MESGQRKIDPHHFRTGKTCNTYHKYYKISCEIHKILKLESAENLGIIFRCDFDSEIKLYPHRKFCMKQNPDNDWKRQNNN